MMRAAEVVPQEGLTKTLARAAAFPRLRYMGSKYRLLPNLIQIFNDISFASALDAFSGSGVVAYALKAMGKSVTANDFLAFCSTVADATIANQSEQLSSADVDRLLGPAADTRDFIRRTFEGLYFSNEDHEFLDSAWSHIDQFEGQKRSLAISALCLAAARKQPRGVFTVTDFRYDDGRRSLRLPLREQARLTIEAYNNVVFDNGQACQAVQADVFDLNPYGYDLVYLDPPYAPPRDDNCYIKRYHFLEGLALYWRGVQIMEGTTTKKLEKRYTPFSYKRTVGDALSRVFEHFSDSIIVLSYSSNAVPTVQELVTRLRRVKPRVEINEIDHRYSFGTHASAKRRGATEFILVGK